MYKKYGRDRETNLELQVKALVAKALEEQGLSTEPRILVTTPGELTLVGSPSKVPTAKVPLQPQPSSIAYGNQLVAPSVSQRPAEHCDGGGNGCGTSS